jgi:hypothetical protein
MVKLARCASYRSGKKQQKRKYNQETSATRGRTTALMISGKPAGEITRRSRSTD